MSFVTYVLLVGIHMGLDKKKKSFSPDVLGMTATSSIFILLVEVLLLKGGSSIIAGSDAPVLDLFAYCGYKFFSYTVINSSVNTVLMSKFFGNMTLLYSVFVYVMFAFGFFIVL